MAAQRRSQRIAFKVNKVPAHPRSTPYNGASPHKPTADHDQGVEVKIEATVSTGPPVVQHEQRDSGKHAAFEIPRGTAPASSPGKRKREQPDIDDTSDHLEVKRSKVNTVTSQSEQLYGNPAEDTIIKWGSRTRKQPKIYAVPAKTSTVAPWRDRSWHEAGATKRIARITTQIPKVLPGQAETRLKSYQDTCPEWFDRGLERARTERMFILSRDRGDEADCHAHHQDCPYEEVQLAGASGNVYTVRISHIPTCTCPHTIFTKNQDVKHCKHIIYVMHFVLKAPRQLMYQGAFLKSELKDLFAHAAPLEGDTAPASPTPEHTHRKPIEGDCPICFMEFDPDEDIVWCEALCGNNIHKACFAQWAQAKAAVTCPFCRSPWELPRRANSTRVTSINGLDLDAERSAGGYRNVRAQLERLAASQGKSAG